MLRVPLIDPLTPLSLSARITPRPTRHPTLPAAHLLSPCLVLFVPLLLLIASGCATHPSERSSAPVPRKEAITELNVLAMPVAVNVSSSGVPDGFSIKVYAGNPSQPKAVPITAGEVEVLMFDGIFGPNSPPNPQPLKTWSFPASELSQYATTSTLGVGYQLSLSWGPTVPKSKRITVLARYHPRQGPAISAAPNPITITGR